MAIQQARLRFLHNSFWILLGCIQHFIDDSLKTIFKLETLHVTGLSDLMSRFLDVKSLPQFCKTLPVGMPDIMAPVTSVSGSKSEVVGRSNEKKSRLCEACTEFVDDNLIDRSNMGRNMQETQETRDVEHAGEAVPDDGVENDDDGPSDEEDTDNRADFRLDRDKEYLEHLYQPRDAWEGKQEEHGAHADEWKKMADAGFRRFVACVRAYCMEVGGLEEQDVFMICKLAQQVVKQMERPTQDDSMDILKYVKVKRVPGPQLWVKISSHGPSPGYYVKATTGMSWDTFQYISCRNPLGKAMVSY